MVVVCIGSVNSFRSRSGSSPSPTCPQLSQPQLPSSSFPELIHPPSCSITFSVALVFVCQAFAFTRLGSTFHPRFAVQNWTSPPLVRCNALQIHLFGPRNNAFHPSIHFISNSIGRAVHLNTYVYIQYMHLNQWDAYIRIWQSCADWEASLFLAPPSSLYFHRGSPLFVDYCTRLETT
jgi:hypothetical protein